MKTFTLILFISLSILNLYAQGNNETPDKFNYLIGTWQGEGTGNPGEGGGVFSFNYDLNKNIIVRKSHSEYPAAKDKPLIIHDDLMIIYRDETGDPGKAVYFDSEGHVINYNIHFPDSNNIVFTSLKTGNGPAFRLTYSRIDSNLMDVNFEISIDGKTFTSYVKGKSKRI